MRARRPRSQKIGFVLHKKMTYFRPIGASGKGNPCTVGFGLRSLSYDATSTPVRLTDFHPFGILSLFSLLHLVFKDTLQFLVLYLTDIFKAGRKFIFFIFYFQSS
jgi:hypothetical protein